MQHQHSNTTKLTDFGLNYWLTKYPSIHQHYNQRKRDILNQFKLYFNSTPAYPPSLATREVNTIVKVLRTLELLEDTYKKEVEKRKTDKTLPAIKRTFPEIKDSLAYITIGHIAKDLPVLRKGLELEGLHLRDYVQFCTYTEIRPNFEP
jgi:hypothetical protein